MKRVGGNVQERAEDLILSSATACGISRLSPMTQLFLFFSPFVEPAGIPCLLVTSSTQKEQCTDFSVLVEVAKHSVENGWHKPLKTENQGVFELSYYDKLLHYAPPSRSP